MSEGPTSSVCAQRPTGKARGWRSWEHRGPGDRARLVLESAGWCGWPIGRRSLKRLALLSKLLSTRASLGQYLIAARAFAYSELGARTRIRTRDQLIKSQLLYQLSYAGAPVILFVESSSACRRNHGRPPALLSKLLSNPKNCCQTSRRRKGQLLELPELLSATPALGVVVKCRPNNGAGRGLERVREPISVPRFSLWGAGFAGRLTDVSLLRGAR